MDPQKILDYGAKLIVIFMCIPIHEYAHAWAATKLGDDTPRYQGRLSLSPLPCRNAQTFLSRFSFQ